MHKGAPLGLSLKQGEAEERHRPRSIHNHPRKEPPHDISNSKRPEHKKTNRRKKPHSADNRTRKEKKRNTTYYKGHDKRTQEKQKEGRRDHEREQTERHPRQTLEGEAIATDPTSCEKKKQEARSETPASPADHVCRGCRLTRMHPPSDYLWDEQRR